ncbi:MAG: replication/maintenance protein RepL [Ekhidna sp.]|nr:replication/maintenance protein RepL [Ekhidna sp.]
MSNHYFQESERIITNDGEQLSLTIKTRKRVQKDKFVMMYLEDLSGVLKLNTKGDYKVLLALVSRAGYNTNEVRIQKDVKIEIAEETNLAYNSVNRAVVSLTQKNLIIRKVFQGKAIRGIYTLNPKYFFKGSDIERHNVLQTIFEYEIIK